MNTHDNMNSGIYTLDLSDDLLDLNTITVNSTSAQTWSIANGGDLDFNNSTDLIVSGDVKIQGQSMSEWMAQVERRLAILRPDPDLEAEFDQLRELGDQYRKLQAELEAKMATWDILKSQD